MYRVVIVCFFHHRWISGMEGNDLWEEPVVVEEELLVLLFCCRRGAVLPPPPSRLCPVYNLLQNSNLTQKPTYLDTFFA